VSILAEKSDVRRRRRREEEKKRMREELGRNRPDRPSN
jgi:hypothetical protein